MMRINLLPPETLERRKAEKRIGWVALAAILIAVALAVVWGGSYFRLQGKQDELAVARQQVELTTAQADQLAIFEARATELEARKAIAFLALSGRHDWAKLLNEVSLVLPADLWAETSSVDEIAGLTLTGYAIDTPRDSPDLGHKSIAKMLVRLADLDQLNDVWLTSSVKSDYAEQPVLQFTVTADVVAPATEGTQ